VAFDAMVAALRAAEPGTVVVLHACCHNPTGYDLTPAQWETIVEVMQAGRLVPFLDMAYQGFGQGIAEDGAPVLRFLDSGLDFLVATSFSKSFSLYGERVVCEDADEAARVLSQLKIVVRTNYSNPPTFGAQVVTTVLGSPALRQQWEEELAAMRQRIRVMREALLAGLQAAGVGQDMSFITRQVGMFSYSGLSAAQMQRLRAEFGVYGTDSGRICVAALNRRNLERVVQAIVSVL
jgi:aromatic-amino-acid transaminase